MRRHICLVRLVGLALLVACCAPEAAPVSRTTEYQVAAITVAETPIATAVAATPLPTAPITLTPIASATPTPKATLKPAPTATATPTRSIPPGAAEVCGIGRVQLRREPAGALCFLPPQQDWYRTTDCFASYERVALGGVLAPDLETRVVFNCTDAGSICVARPAASETLIPLPFHYEPRQGRPQECSTWLPDNQRLIFSITYPTWENRDDPFDFRLYWLDLRGPELHQIASELAQGFDWAVSPLGTCVAYASYDGSEEAQFHVTNVEPYRANADWSVPSEGPAGRWPDSDTPMDWSPDGRQLAFILYFPDVLVIWVVYLDN